MRVIHSLLTERDPDAVGRPSKHSLGPTDRGYLPPDAAMPGPIARVYPIEALDDDDDGGGESTFDRDPTNQDRI